MVDVKMANYTLVGFKLFSTKVMLKIIQSSFTKQKRKELNKRNKLRNHIIDHFLWYEANHSLIYLKIGDWIKKMNFIWRKIVWGKKLKYFLKANYLKKILYIPF